MSSTALTTGRASGITRAPNPSGLAEVIDLILDKGLVIDLYVRVSLVGIELLVIDARIVVASVDTYLRFAEAVNRLDIAASDDSEGLPELLDDLRETTRTRTRTTTPPTRTSRRSVRAGAARAARGGGRRTDPTGAGRAAGRPRATGSDRHG
jgi:hypothetical protein